MKNILFKAISIALFWGCSFSLVAETCRYRASAPPYNRYAVINTGINKSFKASISAVFSDNSDKQRNLDGGICVAAGADATCIKSLRVKAGDRNFKIFSGLQRNKQYNVKFTPYLTEKQKNKLKSLAIVGTLVSIDSAPSTPSAPSPSSTR